MRVLIVLPTYNEAANIENVLDRVRRALPDASILVVDDDSPDGTAKIAEDFGDRRGNVVVLSRAAKLGLGSAYRAGFAWGLERGYEALVEMDSDLSHDPDALRSLVTPLEEGYEVCIGSRYVPGGSIPNWSLPRRLLSKGGNLYANVLLDLHVRDSTAGFRAYAATVLRRIDLSSVRADSYGFQIEMTYRAIRAGACGARGTDPFRGSGARDFEDVHLHGRGGAGPRHLVGCSAGDGAASLGQQGNRTGCTASRVAVSEGGNRETAGGAMLPIDLGAGQVVVLVHGQPGAGADWAAVASRLAADHRVLAPDRPGWGSDVRSATGLGRERRRPRSGPRGRRGTGRGDGGRPLARWRCCHRAGPEAPGACRRARAHRVRRRLWGAVGVRSPARRADAGQRHRRRRRGRASARPIAATRYAERHPGARIADRVAVLPTVQAAVRTDARPLVGRARQSFLIEQRALVAETPALERALCRIAVPTVVVTGASDRIVPPAAARSLAAAPPGSRARRGLGWAPPAVRPSRGGREDRATLLGASRQGSGTDRSREKGLELELSLGELSGRIGVRRRCRRPRTTGREPCIDTPSGSRRATPRRPGRRPSRPGRRSGRDRAPRACRGSRGRGPRVSRLRRGWDGGERRARARREVAADAWRACR